MTEIDDIARDLEGSANALRRTANTMIAGRDSEIVRLMQALEGERRVRRELELSVILERKRADDLKNSLDMYARAWARELGGLLIPKTHEIDALVLTTQHFIAQIDWAKRIILGQKVEEIFAEVFAHARTLTR